MASFRADLIDGMLAESEISDIVSARILPIIFTFEDMKNTAANARRFPIITVEQITRSQENNLTEFSCLYSSTIQISLFHEVHVKALRSKLNTTVVKERNKIRIKLDLLFDEVETYLKGLRNTILGDHFVRTSEITNSIEEEFQIDKNRTILANRIIYETVYSK
tara:strand:+ start:10717 stop:11208 length:492 start_codon:yes stop_codon:yes gene_type:complete